MPKMTDEIKALNKQYSDSLLKLNQILTAKTERGLSTLYTRDLIASVRQEINILNDFSKAWAVGTIPAAYVGGVNEAYKLYRDANVVGSLVAVNNRVVMTIIENTTGALTDVNNYIGRRVEDGIRQAGLQATADKVTQGQTVKKMQQNLKDTLTASGIMEITDKAGRVINVLAYANMVGRTTTREATNRGHIQQVQGIGRDLVKMTTTFSTCPICAPLEGRVYSISGKDKRFPPLSKAFKKGYSTIHPNCTHSALPYIEENDDNFKQTLKDSNKPFTIDKSKEASLKRYYEDQKKKAARRVDLKEYEKLKKDAPGTAPKTFSAFRSKKAASIKAAEKAKAAKAAIPKTPPPKGGVKSSATATKSGAAIPKPVSTGTPVKTAFTAQTKVTTHSVQNVPYDMINKSTKNQYYNSCVTSFQYTNAAKTMTLEEYEKAASKHLMDMVNKGAPVVRRKPGSSLKIVNEGRFKTQFEIQGSGGMFNPSRRADVEQRLFAAPKDLDPTARPVYGYVREFDENGTAAQQYGTVIFQLKREQIAERTTITFADSLAENVTPSFIDDITIDSVRDGTDILTRYSSLADVTSYPEIQVHGGLSMDDVETVLFEDSNAWVYEYADVKKKLDELGIPWMDI